VFKDGPIYRCIEIKDMLQMKCGKKKQANKQTSAWELGKNELQAVQPNAMHAS
jgi:hypothetical protein